MRSSREDLLHLASSLNQVFLNSGSTSTKGPAKIDKLFEIKRRIFYECMYVHRFKGEDPAFHQILKRVKSPERLIRSARLDGRLL